MSKLIVVILWMYAIGCTYLLVAHPVWFPKNLQQGAWAGCIAGYICAIFTTIAEILWHKG